MARILLLLDSSGDQRLLAQFLETAHTVIQPNAQLDVAGAIAVPSDMAIVGWLQLQQVWPQLRAKRQATLPVLWPVLLAVAIEAIPQVDQPLWDCIDELIAVPMRQAELQTRIRVLLRSQQLSHDLTMANHQLRDRNAQLEDLNRLKSQFVSMVSHEFRNPLGVVSGYAKLLHRAAQSPQQHSYLTRIQDTLRRLTTLVDDVLIMGRVGVGKLRYEPATLDLVAFCQQLVGEVQFSHSESQPVNFTLAPDCEARLAEVCMDENLLRHILVNLLTNALKYSPGQQTILLTLACSTDSDPDQVTFTIRDDGIGIPLPDQAKLFEPFHRAENVGDIGGTGLGLAIVKQCVELHQGQIDFCSQPDVGTEFTVTLPCRGDITGNFASSVEMAQPAIVPADDRSCL